MKSFDLYIFFLFCIWNGQRKKREERKEIKFKTARKYKMNPNKK